MIYPSHLFSHGFVGGREDGALFVVPCQFYLQLPTTVFGGWLGICYFRGAPVYILGSHHFSVCLIISEYLQSSSPWQYMMKYVVHRKRMALNQMQLPV